MKAILTFADASDHLVEVVSSRDAALVIGAGASASSGAPLTGELVDRLRERFPQAEYDPNSKLFDFCNAICDTPAYGRQELVRFVNALMVDLQPSAAYKQLPRIRWRALFTTNYDDLIQKAFATPSKEQTLRVVNLTQPATVIPREKELFLFHLMGSIRADPYSPDSPVLSWRDYLRSVRMRAPMLDLIRNILADGGRFVYVGYSFNDFAAGARTSPSASGPDKPLSD